MYKQTNLIDMQISFILLFLSCIVSNMASSDTLENLES